ncbi:hypothetical protein BDR26DRAFT_860485 [Obelidium mucronatum]|nr:hypothetical protein BDR26DRAFT_860485 [Obelidium mucronatum]
MHKTSFVSRLGGFQQHTLIPVDSPSTTDCSPESPFCRICLGSEDPKELFSPCRCKGSSLHVHRHCLKTWINVIQPPQVRLGQRDTEPIKCYSCGYVYRWGGSAFGRIVAGYANVLGLCTVFLVYLCMGDVWHNFDGIHQWFGETQFEREGINYTSVAGFVGENSWQRLNASYASTSLEKRYCGNDTESWCIPQFFRIFQDALSCIMVGMSLSFEGWVLSLLMLRPDGYSLHPVFQSVHILGYLTGGSLMPFNVFTLLMDASSSIIDVIITGFTLIVSSAYAGVCSSLVILNEIVVSQGASQNIFEAITVTASTSFSHIYLNGSFAEECKNIPASVAQLLEVLGAFAKVMCLFWVWMVEMYYFLMLVFGLYDCSVEMVESVQVGLLKRVEEDILEYR